MLRVPSYVLLTLLLTDGGHVTPEPAPGVTSTSSTVNRADGGTVSTSSIVSGLDGGTTASSMLNAEGEVRWPDEVRPLATLDGPAVVAAHAALQRVLTRFPKRYATACTYSAKAMEVLVGQEGDVYFVQIKRRPDKCGWAAPGFNIEFDWFELYAVSSDGRILARYPYHP